jgi:hypothetical protein
VSGFSGAGPLQRVDTFGKGLPRIFHAPEVFIGRYHGFRRSDLRQTFDNKANGHFRERPSGDIFATPIRKTSVTNRKLIDETIYATTN